MRYQVSLYLKGIQWSMLLIPLIEMKLFLGNLINSDQRDGEKSKKLSIYWVNSKLESNHVTVNSLLICSILSTLVGNNHLLNNTYIGYIQRHIYTE